MNFLLRPFQYIFILVLPVMFVSCSGGGGGDKTTVNIPAPQNPDEETPDPEVSTGCLTDSRKQSVRTFLDRLSNSGSITGPVQYKEINDDGSYSTFALNAAYDFVSTGDLSWRIDYIVCFEEQCSGQQTNLSILADGCLYINQNKTKVTSSSDSHLNFTATDGDDAVSQVLKISSGKFSHRETYKLDGDVMYDYSFRQR